MQDVTMCTGGACPQKYGCMRFLGEIDGRQDFFGNPPFKNDGTCEHLMNVREALMIRVPREYVTRRAYEIFKENRSYHDYAWFLAELVLLIEHVVRGDLAVLNIALYKSAPESWVLSKAAIPQEDIRIAARTIAGKHATVQELHWCLAEASIFVNMLQQRVKETWQHVEK
jgi:hypothetical protein